MSDTSIVRRIASSIAALALGLIITAPAHADPVAEAKAVNDVFTKAFEACDVPAVLDLYEDNAIVIWPGEGEFAIGKPAFEKIVKAYCSNGSKPSIKVISSDARQIGRDYILHFGQLDGTVAGPDGKPTTIRLRTTELFHKSHGKWRFAMDHASEGIPPPAGADAGKTP